MKALSDESYEEAKAQTEEVLGLTYKRDLGKGQFGTVFLAEDRNGKKHAVKVCSTIGPDYLVAYVKREFQIQQTIRHENVVQMYGGIDTNPDFIVMDLEFCDKDLETLIEERKDKGFTPAETRKMFRDILQGLNALHSRGIAHRDLKPANLMVSIHRDNSFTVKIGDLGFAKKVADGTQTQLGTPLYEAPEIMLKNREKYGIKCDIWSVGLILQEILFRNHPYFVQMERNRTRNIKTMLEREIPFTIEEGSGVSDCCRHFVNNFLFYDPDSRYSVPEALEHPFLMEPAQVVSFVGKTSPVNVGDMRPLDVYFGDTVFDKYLKASSYERLSKPHAVATWDVTWGDIVESSMNTTTKEAKGTPATSTATAAAAAAPAATIDMDDIVAVSNAHEFYRMNDRYDPKESKNLKVLAFSFKEDIPELTICDSDPQEELRVSQFLMSSAEELGVKTVACMNEYLKKGGDLRTLQRNLINETSALAKLFEFLSEIMFNNETAQKLLDEIGSLQDQASEVITGFSPIHVTAMDFQTPVLTDVKRAERAQRSELHSFISSLKGLKESAEKAVTRDRYHIDVSQEVAQLRDVITSFTKVRQGQASQLSESFAQLKNDYAVFRNAKPTLFLAFSYIECLREALSSRDPSRYLSQLKEFCGKFAVQTQVDQQKGLLQTFKTVVQERDKLFEENEKLQKETTQKSEIIEMLRAVLREKGIPDPTAGM